MHGRRVGRLQRAQVRADDQPDLPRHERPDVPPDRPGRLPHGPAVPARHTRVPQHLPHVVRLGPAAVRHVRRDRLPRQQRVQEQRLPVRRFVQPQPGGPLRRDAPRRLRDGPELRPIRRRVPGVLRLRFWIPCRAWVSGRTIKSRVHVHVAIRLTDRRFRGEKI